ncbi:MAG TPA: carboxypeptidase regulatory-like domain-containing protein [Stenotrophomonas sp.]|nr:carboxypeptidase regulatory-like domain-containing protein [Stenotrophomonas sp.]
MSSWQIATALVLALVGLAAPLRLLRQTSGARGWRRNVLLALQPLCALALYLTLYPPSRPVQGGTLVVLTAGATSATRDAASVALPEAGSPTGATPVPDLATALRQRPGTARLRVVGQGLPARDREAVGGLPLQFEPAAPLPGLIQLSAPAPVAPGNDFSVRGQLAGMPGARVELLDPAGRRVEATAADAQGRFTLRGQARMAGQALFGVRVLDRAGTERERQPLPLQVVEAPALRVWIMAGAPQPEWKYLRRWAADAGLSLHTQIAVGNGLQLGDAPLPMEAATLDRFDLLWLDQRALASLSPGQRERLLAAVQRGLGVLVRLDGPADAGLRQALAQLGLPMRGGDGTTPLAMPLNAAGEPGVALTVRDYAPTLPLAILASDAKQRPYAWWRAAGEGRIGVTALTDSYRLPLAGDAGSHGRRWSQALAELARARRSPQDGVELPALAWAGERMAVCGVGEAAQVLDPTGAGQRLQRDAATGTRACAAYWPSQAGWHVLAQGEQRHAFYVRDPAQARAWYRHELAAATARQVRAAAVGPVAQAPALPGSRWPAWWAFALLVAASWWLERPRRA